MIEKISIFFNNNPLLGIIIVILLVIIIWNLLKNTTKCQTPEKLEHLTQLPKCDMNTDHKFNTEFVGPMKLINFKTVYNGKEYYLANMEMTKCQNKETKDCANAVLLLLEKHDIENLMLEYKKDLDTTKDICISTNKILCEKELPVTASEEEKQKCLLSHSTCDQHRHFYHDFNVKEIIQNTSDLAVRRKYIIKGSAIPMKDGSVKPTMLNQFLYNDSNINLLCADSYNYGQLNLPTEYAEIIISEKELTNDGGIIGGNHLKIKLRFNTNVHIISKDTTGNDVFTLLIDNITGKPKTKASYIGICLDKTCKTDSNKEYIRACLYDDIDNPNILEFEPILINAN